GVQINLLAFFLYLFTFDKNTLLSNLASIKDRYTNNKRYNYVKNNQKPNKGHDNFIAGPDTVFCVT
ncbi:hypothetical protein, partial [Actinobacillus ureae]|uniref:hypothetical protein n=1 Tax=Actinobacillus ureae TaxID=723 RepID=UPI001AD84465